MKQKKKTRDTAVALRYKDGEDNAPKVVAKGYGVTAENIRKVAEASGIPVTRDDDLVELLAQIEIDREIPPQLYSAVAEVLSLIYRANSSIGGRKE
ncbi:MAG: EscU/YscU/HrcU family type III secretion system export apparatus switch protein [Chitinispirillaceae bacterium]